MNQLIRCVNCDEVFLKTPFDQSPEYEPTHPGQSESYRMTQKDDFEDFLKLHRDHRLEPLTILKDSFISEGLYQDPLRTSYFKATNGKEVFLIKRSRQDIHQPMKYQLIYGDYELKLLRLEAQSEAILKQWSFEFKKNPSLLERGETFLGIFQKVLHSLRIDQLERIDEESPSPLDIYHRLDDIGLAFLLRNCRNRFKGKDYSEVEGFINRHKDDGVLLVKATYQIQIHEKVKTKKEAIPDLLSLEKQKALQKKKS